MNERIAQSIVKMQAALRAGYPKSAIAGFLPAPVASGPVRDEFARDYWDFLKLTDGVGSCAISLWSMSEFPKQQYCVGTYCADDRDSQCIGRVVEDPLFLRRSDGAVRLIDRYGFTEIGAFASLDDFLENVVFGGMFSQYVPDAEHDEWYSLLIKTVGIGGYSDERA